MEDTFLPNHLLRRLEELRGRESSYWEDEFYSEEALTNLHYREHLEKVFTLDPLGPLPPRQT
jgi:hypothetical protein